MRDVADDRGPQQVPSPPSCSACAQHRNMIGAAKTRDQGHAVRILTEALTLHQLKAHAQPHPEEVRPCPDREGESG